ncbi:MAG: asparagine--tRNA ligase [Firmicutes bacterium]|nr:asparagine--tRNA ligase [Bacillota bacterium]
MKHIDIAKLYKTKEDFIDTKVTVCGWVRTSRDSKNMAFLELNDGTCLKHLQIVLDKSALNQIQDGILDLGAALKIEGILVKSQNGDSIEVNAEKIIILGRCPLDYPLQKKRHGLDYLRTIPHLRLRTNTFNAMLRIRDAVSIAIHEYFSANNYVWVHTPILTGSDCEGAGEVFRVTTHAWDAKFKNEDAYSKSDFFAKQAGLTVSGQLEGEMAAMALGKIYTFGPTFRAEKSNTTRHAAEFWMIEPEIAFAELEDILEVAEELIKYIIGAVLDKCETEIKLFDAHFENGLIDKLRGVLSSDFEVLTYTKAIDLLKKAKGIEFKFPIEWGLDLQTEHERYITEVIFKKPVFVTDYPMGIKSFYMKQNADGKTVAATDLLLPGIGEIIGGSQREDDYDKLLKAIKDRGMNAEDYKEYLELRKFGSCPHGGFGLGLERILLYITGIGNIRDVQLFPRTVGYMA